MADEIINIEPQITLKEAVQRRLAADLDADAGLQARLEADPDSVIKPIIAELLGDDGSIDLSKVRTSVHVESDTDLHFVVTPGAGRELAEVSGFAMTGLSLTMQGTMLDIGGVKPVPMDPVTRRYCSTDSPDATTHRHCNTRAKNCQII
ncbi:MAG: hypothetical protein U0Q03_24360 [Acidimicrobiales bacterium]